MLRELIVDDYGVSLHKKSERLILKQNGKVKEEIAIKELDDLIISDRCGMVSIALIEELIQNGTQIHMIDYKQQPFVTVYTPAHHGSVKARREQFTSYNDKRSVVLSKELIRCKIRNQINLIKYYLKSRRENELIKESFEQNIDSMKEILLRLSEIKGKNIDTVRKKIVSLEAHAAKYYWKSIKLLLQDKIDFKGREQLARDPVNMMLNYGYGILRSRVSASVIRAGLEPYAGFIHVDRSGRPSLELDFMEMFRQPFVDRVVISLLTRGFTAKHGEQEDGAIFLDNRTKITLRDNLMKRLDTRETYDGKEFLMKTIIQLQARELASFFREGTPFKGFVAKW